MNTHSPFSTPTSTKRSEGFDSMGQARSSRVKSQAGKDAGSVGSSATGATEDTASRSLFAARVVSGTSNRAHPAVTGKETFRC